MAHFSELKDGSDFNKVNDTRACRLDGFIEIPVKFGGVGGLEGDNRLRSMFDELLPVFLKELSVDKVLDRPFPPKLGDGKEVDLFKLFWVVRSIGGYESVAKNGLWEFVAGECGLEVRVVVSLKLVYVKYLKELDQWLSQKGFNDKKLGTRQIGLLERLVLLSQEVGYKGHFSSGEEKAKSNSEVEVKFDEGKYVGTELSDNEGGSGEKTGEDLLQMILDGSDRGKYIDTDSGKTEVDFSVINDVGERSSVKDDKRIVISLKNVVNIVPSFHCDNNIPLSDKDVDLGKTEVKSSSSNDDDENFSVKDSERIVLSPNNAVNKVLFHPDNCTSMYANDDYEKHVTSQDENGPIISTMTAVEKIGCSQKRKREDESSSLSEMLDWIASAARNSHDTAIGTLPNCSKWNKHGSEELWKQALIAREALLVKRNVDPQKEPSSSQKNQRMHPAMYNDDKVPRHSSSERLRYSGRVTLAKKVCSCSGCMSCSSSRSKRRKHEAEKNTEDEISETTEVLDGVVYTKRIPGIIMVGPEFQAVVPEWTGIVSESDPKWLGTLMWAPLDEGKDEVDLVIVGKGREDSCECPLRGSAECVRFHVAENRMKISRALGPLFRRWRFNHMGEEVSLSWSLEEENEFKSLVVKARQESCHMKLKHVAMNRFWRRASKSLPGKTKENLLSYYFNVFVLRRRSYQNRVTPDDIDSDNDDEEVGSVGGRFGYEKIHGLTIKCSVNKQCTELVSGE